MGSGSLPQRSQVHFIADIHLQNGVPASWRDFFTYLASAARNCKAIYLLGDIFDAWIGDDDDRELARETMRRLREVTDSGVKIGVVLGNHDFLLGERFARHTGVELLGEQAVIEVEGHKMLIMHGDILCTYDVVYQRQRRKYMRPWFLKLIMLLPRWERRRRATKMVASGNARILSEKHIKVNEQLVQKMLIQAGTDTLICGHLHVEAGRRKLADGSSYYVLPHWPAVNGPGGALVVDQAGMRLVSLGDLDKN